MPTQRGFVERLEVGRAGLAVASILHDDGTRADYRIPDLDADPERFNERLSKLGILRDAMTRAEPVEIEFKDQDGGRVIDRVVRITRDALAQITDIARPSVMIVGVALASRNATGANAEAADEATVVALMDDGSVQSFVLDMQIPERGVATGQLNMIMAAQASGETITLQVSSKTRRIAGVESGGAMAGGGGGETDIFDGFVETIACAPELGGPANMALVELTTAPSFTDDGNVVELVPFTPERLSFLVVEGSHEYDLFLASLRDKLRVRVLAGAAAKPREAPPPTNTGAGAASQPAGNTAPGKKETYVSIRAKAGAGGHAAAPRLVRGVQLLVALASASRPVWIQISRKSLDMGPDIKCTPGLPSSDLTPIGLRDLHIPYTAEWTGCGCFNHGIYRFQFDLPVEFTVTVDGKELCVHSAAEGRIKFAHACLDGEHCVTVVLHGWTCRLVFKMDVYRIR